MNNAAISYMKTFKNPHFTKRDHETTNVVACRAMKAPKTSAGSTIKRIDDEFVEVQSSEIEWPLVPNHFIAGMTRLYVQAGIEYWGYL